MHEFDATSPGITERLQLCPVCSTPFVEPESLLGFKDDGVEVLLRCGNCAWREAQVASVEAFEELDRALDMATTQMLADRRALAVAAAEEDFERFISALRAGAVLPEDF